MTKKLTGLLGLVGLFTSALIIGGCGGGGGSPGTVSGSGGSGGTGGGTGAPVVPVAPVVVPAPSIQLALLNGTTATTSVSATGATTASATVRDENGQLVAGKLVTFSADAALVTFSPSSGAVLTNSSGVATIQLSPASITSAGAGVLSVATSVTPAGAATGVLTSTSLDFQLSAANLTLSTLDIGSATPLPAYGTRAVSVFANINGTPATNTPVQVTFSASCGAVTPATVTTDGTGKASASYTANSVSIPGCAGANATIAATATGATTLNGTVNVQATQATNIQFLSATPQLIYLVGSVGATQSQVSFKLVDSSGNPLQNQSLQLSLNNTGTGVSLGTVGNTAPVNLTSDSQGTVSVPVFSGSIPSSLQVNATLLSNTSVNARSNILTVASGVPVQKAASLAVERLSIEGFNTDGQTTNVTMSLADRQGNPVPVGTSVNFVSSSGVMVPASCTVPARPDGTSSSACAVTIRSQGTRPMGAGLAGKVAILAYTPGEEDFTDVNSNNIYDGAETFVDLGNAYRDDNLDGVFDAGEFSVPRAGSSACGGGVQGRPNTCDGVWGANEVRVQSKVIFATGQAKFPASNPSALLIGSPNFILSDLNDNSMPTGTTIVVEGRSSSPTGTCTATVAPAVVPNTLEPIIVSLRPASTCGFNDLIDVTITSPLGVVTSHTFRLDT
ncbi:MAG: Ig-like domain-containing protein [Pseudomonadota bacterium]